MGRTRPVQELQGIGQRGGARGQARPAPTGRGLQLGVAQGTRPAPTVGTPVAGSTGPFVQDGRHAKGGVAGGIPPHKGGPKARPHGTAVVSDQWLVVRGGGSCSAWGGERALVWSSAEVYESQLSLWTAHARSVDWRCSSVQSKDLPSVIALAVQLREKGFRLLAFRTVCLRRAWLWIFLAAAGVLGLQHHSWCGPEIRNGVVQ